MMNNTVSQQPKEQIPSRYVEFMKTGREIEQVISKDSNYPDLADMLKETHPVSLDLMTAATSSTYALPLINSEREFSEIGKINTPAHLYDRIANVQCRTFSGIFPQISRAWLTIDNILYLWDYTEPDASIFEYKDQDQVITTAEIMKPKKGILDESVEYVIAVATPLQIIFIAASNTAHASQQYGNKAEGYQYFATRATISTDEVRCRKMFSTEDGRLFLISNDGSLHEIFLACSADSWFGRDHMVRRTYSTAPSLFQRLLNTVQHPFIQSAVVDNERNILYLLCERSMIEVVYLGDPAQPYKPVFMYSSITEDGIQLARQSGKTSAVSDFEVSSIHVISTQESKRYHLVAVTKTGHRLYFSHHQDGIRSTMATTGPPNSLVLGHIRFPPVEPIQPGEIAPVYSKSFYDRGLCISVRARDDLSDSLQIASVGTGKLISPKTNPSTNYTNINNNNTSLSDSYYETRASLQIPEKVGTLVELKNSTHHALNEVSEQLSDTPRRFAVLTTQHIRFYQKQRPVDILHYLIQQYNTQSNLYRHHIETFSEKYSQREACAMCLSIACHSVDTRVIETAVKLFERFGGQPSSTSAPRVMGNFLTLVAKGDSVVFSGKRDGLLLYFARLISPVWKLKFFTASEPLDSQIVDKLTAVKENLVKLRNFLDRFPQLHTSPDITDPKFELNDDSSISSEVADRQSMHAIYITLVKAIEAISFITFAVDAIMYTGIKQFLSDNVDKDKVYVLDLCSILTTVDGREFVDEIVIGIIVRFRSGYGHVGHHFVSEELQTKCSNFFGPDSIAFYKGLEHLLSVDYEDSEAEKDRDLRQSLAYFKQAADNLPKLASICTQYKRHSFHMGIIELALERAHRLDPTEKAFLAYEDPELQTESNMALIFDRFHVYTYILDALADAAAAKSNPALPEYSRIQNPPQFYQNLLNRALASTDRCFHYRLYQWLIENNLMSDLLSVNSPLLLRYLERYESDKKMKYEFLYQYYRTREDYIQASRYMTALAHIDNISLESRSEYFANALITAQCIAFQAPEYDHDYVNQLRQRLAWVQLQKRVQDIIRIQGGLDSANAIEQLNRSLFSPDQLRTDFAQFPHIVQLLNEEAARSS
ncbi:Nup133 N terminal like-domain-containing protein [Choanephora cucurbitarum]|nr:Nup133 N terminal like-domain-containing protein [Choanephora cucurbitarum]